MSSLPKLTEGKYLVHRNRWVERLIAIIAAINLSFVFFDLSYVPWRDFYFQEFPRLTQLYDPIKGIKPHRETQNYLAQVNKLEDRVEQTGLQSTDVEGLLQELRRLSNEMIQDNPFAVANKSGTLEKIKNQIRTHVGLESAHQAFNRFWSYDYLSQTGWQQEFKFFDIHVRPLIQTNYYRRIGFNGKFIDAFWLIDLPFLALFSVDILARIFSIKRTYTKLTWMEAILRRWYDLFLLFPFWRWLRVIPVVIRLYQSDLLDLKPVQRQIKRDFVTNFAEELTEIVGIQIINQIQESIRRGNFARWLFQPETRRPYIKLNNTNEVKAIASRLLHLSVYQVLPKVQPDIEALMHYNIESILKQSSIYQQLQAVPALNHLPTQLTEKLVTQMSQAAYSTLTTSLEDPVVIELSNRIFQNFSTALATEIQEKQNLQEIQSLLLELLEEFKINYVKDIAEIGVEKTLAEATQIQQIVRS
ncbi:MAG: hypothetical protein JOZ78_02775 [Chroococcidiopsidaceae cyanobacterium CP_BM_ER_R8_30]|nr:hypothetical protein [Chroococcidiopsidaceae cyanobacterium CP_BM_ER_R8_30]